MRITESKVTKLTIDQLEALDPITVFAEDVEPRKGKITVSCYGKSWTAYWGGMGDRSLAEFFCSCNEDYIAGYFDQSLESTVFSNTALAKTAQREVLKQRRALDLGAAEARRLFDNCEDLNQYESLEAVFHVHGETMELLFGEEWWRGLSGSTEPNSDYLYLCRIIKAVQQALATTIKPAKRELEQPQ